MHSEITEKSATWRKQNMNPHFSRAIKVARLRDGGWNEIGRRRLLCLLSASACQPKNKTQADKLRDNAAGCLLHRDNNNGREAKVAATALQQASLSPPSFSPAAAAQSHISCSFFHVKKISLIIIKILIYYETQVKLRQRRLCYFLSHEEKCNKFIIIRNPTAILLNFQLVFSFLA